MNQISTSTDILPLATRFDLRGRHIAVTGAANGLGLAICQGLLEFGAVVTAIDHDGDALKAAADQLGCRRRVRPAGLRRRRPGRDRHGHRGQRRRAGPARRRFANAGIAGGPSLEVDEGRIYELDWATFDHAMSVNLRGALATIKAAAIAMRPSGRGSIVATVSTAGLRGESMVGTATTARRGR